MKPDVAFRMVLRRLLNAFHPRNFRQYFGEQPRLIQELKRSACMPFGEHLDKLVATRSRLTAWMRGASDRIAATVAGSSSKPNRRGKAHAAQHPQMVFFKASLGSADRPDEPASRSSAPPTKSSRPGQISGGAKRVEQRPVDREIPSLHILLGAYGVAHGVGMPPVGVDAIDRDVAASVTK